MSGVIFSVNPYTTAGARIVPKIRAYKISRHRTPIRGGLKLLIL